MKKGRLEPERLWRLLFVWEFSRLGNLGATNYHFSAGPLFASSSFTRVQLYHLLIFVFCYLVLQVTKLHSYRSVKCPSSAVRSLFAFHSRLRSF